MLPQNSLSDIFIPGAFLPPDNLPVSATTSIELGGIGLSNSSQGSQVQTWTAQLYNAGLVNSYVAVSSPNTSSTVLLTVPNIIWITLAFDQNMKPALSYMANGTTYLWWYDNTIPGYTTLTMLAGTKYPQMTLDDKRALSISLGLSDMILVYLRGTNMYVRNQRDRFTIEYVLSTAITMVNPQIYKIGMATSDRVLFQITANL